ncbi:hypothetical protein EAX61_11320 [Dokdonia sinensis]|uniref:DUF4345 domain-containing protein n=1 Tax=Dokdonia sinensis TaxID=2479847 RepID=A0A3M0FX43_9FLAO|nr:hypothetical protein [Dokdonia sinensis]RMB57330.1 hypothetical protein EAX61_11320 [Dokdonia sinensis]
MNKPNALFWVIAVIALLWNIMGLSAFTVDTFFSEMLQSSYTAAQITAVENAPIWSKIAYGTATITGFLAAVFLLMKKKLAVNLFLISLLASVVHGIYISIVMGAPELFGTFQGIIFPVIIIVLDLFFYLYSKKCAAKGWIK